MNILVISDKLYPDEYGGSCTVAYELIKHWQKKHNVDIFTCHPEKKENDSLFNGNVKRKFIKKNIFCATKSLKTMLEKNTYDIVITHSVISWFVYYCATFSNYDKSNLIALFHGPWHKEAHLKYEGTNNTIKSLLLPKLMLLIEKLYCKNNDNYIFLSKYMKKELEKISHLINKKNISYIAGGVSLEKYKRQFNKLEAKRKLGISENKYVLFTLRRLDKRMGIDNVIEAISSMTEKERERFTLLIGGKGDYRAVLEKKAEKIKENVRFLGFVPDNELNLYFCATDLFVVPTLDLEGFGLVNLESLAMGVPVLATPQGGMVELNGLFDHFHLCSKNNVEELKLAIIEYSQIYHNKIINENLLEYDWSNISDKYLNLFKQILDR